MQAYNAQIRACNAIAKDYERIDWEQRRYEIAKVTMPQALAIIVETLSHGGHLTEGSIAKQAAMMSVDYAEALIAKLKEKGEEK